MTRRSSIRLLHIVLLLSLSAPIASAQWKIIGNRRFSTFDMVTPHLGLAATDDVGLPILCKYVADTMGGIFTVSDTVTSIIAPDSNTAYFTVRGDGLYYSTSKWTTFTKIFSNDSIVLLAVSGQNIVARINDRVYYSQNGGSAFLPVTGIPTAFIYPMTIYAAGAFSDRSFIAVSGTTAYLSRDGGANWLNVLDNLPQMRSVYCDKINKIVYVAGGALYRSLDSGWHWEKMSNTIFDLKGSIAGTRDCSGTFYLGPDPKTRAELLRTTSLGKFFQDVGPASLSSIRMVKMQPFDRGSTLFWLDSSGLLSVTRVGVDSSVTDSVRSRVLIEADSVLHNSICLNLPASSATLTIGYDQCTGIVLDSIRAVKSNPAFTLTFKPLTLADSSISVPYTFRAKHEGLDSIAYRLSFHSKYTQNFEKITFVLYGIADLSGPGLSLSVSSIDFGRTPVDSTKKGSFTITNTGCDTLVITSVLSSDPTVFEVAGAKMPFYLAPGANTFTSVGFRAREAREYLEAVNIKTNIGTRFVTLRGVGTTTPEDTLDVVKTPPHPTPIAYPNPATDMLTVRGATMGASDRVILVDALGRQRSVPVVSTDTGTITIDLREIPSGAYMLSIGAHTRIMIAKL